MSRRALIVIADPNERFLAAAILRDAAAGIQITEATDAIALTAALEQPGLDVAVLVRDLQWADGLDLVKLVHHRHPGCATILLGTMPENLTDPEQQPDAHLSRSTAGLARLGQVALRAMQRRSSRPRAETTELNNLPVAILELSADERVLSANARAVRLFGCEDARSLVGRSFQALVDSNGKDAAGRLAVSTSSRAASSADGLSVTVLPVDGPPSQSQLLVRPQTKDGVLTGFVAALVPSPAAAGDPMGGLLYAVSHDLQQPLATTGRSAQMLSDRLKAQGGLGDEEERMLRRILSGTSRIDALMAGLLEYVRTGQHPLKIEPFDLGSVCEEMIQAMHERLEETGAVVRWQSLPRIHASRAEITRLLENLVSNAIKFRGTGKPEIEIACAEREDSWVLSVRDNGIGIDPSDAQRIFQPFQRLHTESEYPGTGIGLAICRQVCERHGGRIWVTPNPDRGCTFFATISKGPYNQAL